MATLKNYAKQRLHKQKPTHRPIASQRSSSCSCISFTTVLFAFLMCQVAFVLLWRDELPTEHFKDLLIQSLQSSQHAPSLRAYPQHGAVPFKSSSQQRIDASDPAVLPKELVHTSRVIVLIPYFGATLPSWFYSFAVTAMFSKPLFDWVIVATDMDDTLVYENVRIVHRNRSVITAALLSMDASIQPNATHAMTQALLHLLDHLPYVLVEFKPALGYIFGDLIQPYSHWAYADLDTIIGLADAVITPNVLSDYDIYTISMGDSYRMYMRGQLTIHKNSAAVNNVWRGCGYLSHIGSGLAEYTRTNKWAFQSAEGCYSRVVVDSDLKVLVAPALSSEAFRGSDHQKEALLVGSRLVRCYEHPLDLSDVAGLERFMRGESHRSERSSRTLSRTHTPLFEARYHCEYWIAPEFEVCLSYLPADADVMKTSEGVLSYTVDDSYIVLGHCRETATFHFQGWKRNYYAFNAQPFSLDANILLASDAGLIPYKAQDKSSAALPSFGALTGLRVLFGRLAPVDISSVQGDQVSLLERYRDKPIKLDYCLAFSSDLHRCTCSLRSELVTVLKSDSYGAHSASDVTLVLVASEEEFFNGYLDMTLSSWAGPKILVLARRNASDFSHDRKAPRDTALVLVSLPDCYSKSSVPYFPLYNLGMDVAATGAVCVSPSRVIFEQGSARGARAMMDSVGATSTVPPAFVIPVFSFRNTLNNSSIDLFKFAENGRQSLDLKLLFPCTGIGGYASDQPKYLRFDVRSIGANEVDKNFVRVMVDDNSLSANTAMLPIVFDRTLSVHGHGFARFVEEMAYEHCYGSSFLRAVQGSGYDLFWSHLLGIIPEESDHPAHSTSPRANCSLNSTSKAYVNLARAASSYFKRAEALNSKQGVEDVYSREKFGANFEAEQRNMMGLK